jgi:hypothetical protein
MSTVPIILKHEEPGGRLCRFKPALKGRQRLEAGRPLGVETGVYTWLHAEDGSLTQIKAAIRAHFNRYARGQLIDDCNFMKRVEDRRRPSWDLFGHGVWAVSPRFKPQHRFFGLFAVQDWLIILNKQSRDYLGDSDARWHAEIDESLRLWSELFPNRTPWVVDDLDEYISRNAEKCDDRW